MLDLAPYIRTFEVTLEADKLRDLLQNGRGVAAHDDATFDVLRDHRSGPDQ
jgi:hypothetical protein